MDENEEIMNEAVMNEAVMGEGGEIILETGDVKKKSWSAFVEDDVANFFTGFKLEKMTLEDGNGNKAKLGRTKDCGIKIEYTSTVLI